MDIRRVLFSVILLSLLFPTAFALNDTRSTTSVQPFLSFNINTTSGFAVVGGSAYSVEAKVYSREPTVSTVNVTFFSQNPGNSNYSFLSLNKYVNFSKGQKLNISSVIMKLFYSDTEVNSLGLDEHTFRIEYFNETSRTWTVFNSPYGGTNITGNYAYANVTHFSIFGLFGNETQEEPEETPSPTRGRGGRGAVTITPSGLASAIEGAIGETLKNVQNTVSAPIILEIRPGEYKKSSVTITNTLDKKVAVRIEVSGDAEKFISFKSSSFNLDAGESRDVELRVNADLDAKLGIYDGRIDVVVGNYLTTVPITVNVVSPGPKLLDVKLTPLKTEIYAGEELPLEISLTNLGYTNRVDVEMTIQLLSVGLRRVVLEKFESLALFTNTDLSRKITIPPELSGEYIVRVLAKYKDNEGEIVAVSGSTINILRPTLFRLALPSFASIGKVAMTLLAIIAALFLGFAVKKTGLPSLPSLRSPLSIITSQNSVNLKNKSWSSGNEITQIMAVIDFDGIPKTNEIIYANRKLKFSTYNGGVRDFFKNILSSGPMMMRNGNKVVFALKSDECGFIDLFKGDECSLQFTEANIKKVSVYFSRKTHAFDTRAQIRLWALLEQKYEDDDKNYFSKLLESVKSSKLPAGEDLRNYVKNILKILQ